jgi:hypothetical protein
VSYITPPVSTRLNYGLPVALRSKELTPRTTDAAESINADAMRQYQRRWESHGAQQGTSAQPILYPSKIQRILE